MTAFYNDTDAYCGAWLLNLIAAGHITPGVVDQRSISEIRPEDVMGFDRVHLFAGIAGWDYALRLAGWPAGVPVWTGSCPCQPFSCAGKGLGAADERHLWPEMFRLIRECRPGVVFGEQVASAVGHGWLDGIFADLEGLGYACWATVAGAHSVGAPHLRQRLYWVAVSARQGGRLLSGSEKGMLWRPHARCDHATGRVDDASSARPESARHWTEGQTRDGARVRGPERGCDPGRVGYSQDGQDHFRESGDMAEAERGRGCGDNAVDVASDSGGLADGELEGLEGHAGDGSGSIRQSGEIQEQNRPVAKNSYAPLWSASRWWPCRDGKQRRIPAEPALFPLAHGLPGRVGQLRAAGNSIVPQLAAAFIETVMEAMWKN